MVRRVASDDPLHLGHRGKRCSMTGSGSHFGFGRRSAVRAGEVINWGETRTTRDLSNRFEASSQRGDALLNSLRALKTRFAGDPSQPDAAGLAVSILRDGAIADLGRQVGPSCDQLRQLGISRLRIATARATRLRHPRINRRFFRSFLGVRLLPRCSPRLVLVVGAIVRRSMKSAADHLAH
jgi:hypothetical protein